MRRTDPLLWEASYFTGTETRRWVGGGEAHWGEIGNITGGKPRDRFAGCTTREPRPLRQPRGGTRHAGSFGGGRGSAPLRRTAPRGEPPQRPPACAHGGPAGRRGEARVPRRDPLALRLAEQNPERDGPAPRTAPPAERRRGGQLCPKFFTGEPGQLRTKRALTPPPTPFAARLRAGTGSERLRAAVRGQGRQRQRSLSLFFPPSSGKGRRRPRAPPQGVAGSGSQPRRGALPHLRVRSPSDG